MTRTVLDDAIQAARTFFKDKRINKRWIWKRSKAREHVEPRHFVCAFIRARNPDHFSYPMICRLTKRGDHTSALNSVRWAHDKWGKSLFVKLSAVAVVEPDQTEETTQSVHRQVTADQLQKIGERNLERFVNGKGWEAAA